MTIRLYCDEDSMRHALALALRKRGVDVLTVLEAGTTEELDDWQLAFAASQGRAVYSDQGMSAPLAMEAIQRELVAELDEQGRPKRDRP